MVSRVTKPRRVAVELGCGAGANLGMLAAEGFTVYGLDFSPNAIRTARGRLGMASQEGGATRIHLSVENTLDAPLNRFEPQVICDVGHLCHQNDSDAVRIIERAHDALQPGGYFFATELLAAGTFGLNGPQASCKGTPVEDRGFVNFRTIEAVEELFAPFEHVEIERVSRTYQNRSKFYMRWNVFARKGS